MARRSSIVCSCSKRSSAWCPASGSRSKKKARRSLNFLRTKVTFERKVLRFKFRVGLIGPDDCVAVRGEWKNYGRWIDTENYCDRWAGRQRQVHCCAAAGAVAGIYLLEHWRDVPCGGAAGS